MNQKTADKIAREFISVRKQCTNTLAGFALIHLAITLMIIGLFIGSIYVGKDLVGLYQIHSQISQIVVFDEAIADFYNKFEGLPGDLLAIRAERQGLPTGDGTPSHSDGDGKISPCNLGWQWHLGCETALFWSQLMLTGMISGNYTADSRFTDSRLPHVISMSPYLPQSTLAEGVYIAVWSTVANQPSPNPQLPYGNYFEISRIKGVLDEKFIDDSKALTPLQARAIDRKIDDGLPLSGMISVNGEADWPVDAWGTYAKPGANNCVSLEKEYNVADIIRAQTPLCHLAIQIRCCKTQTRPE